MKPNYQVEFEREFLASALLRVKMLSVFFLVGFIYSWINYLIIREAITEEVRVSLRTSTIFLLCMTILESGAVLFVSRQIRLNRTIALWHQYANAFVEISSPTLVIILLAQNISTPQIVVSTPLVSLYFLFIILSTLRLDFKISIFISVIGATEYFIVGNFLTQDLELKSIDQLTNSHLTTNGKALSILCCGLGAAFVASQTRKKINNLIIRVEKETRLINLFGQQISKEIVEEMLHIDGKIPSKLLKVCIMFIDIRNFTNYVVGKSPAEVVDYQNAFFSIIIDIVTRNGGIINQFLGDGCMVTFGAPTTIEKPCQCAVKSALEIREELNRKSTMSLIVPTDIGIGIHVGEAVTGNIGTDVRQQYSITGSVVILASRIEQLNKNFNSQILISQDVLDEIEFKNLNIDSIGPVSLKGWNEPIHIYKIA